MRAMPERDRRELETIVRLYEPAIPQTPAVRAEDIPAALALFPDGMPKPDLTGIDLGAHVAPSIASAVSAPVSHTARAWTIVLVVTLIVGVAAFFATRGRRRAPKE
jgi:hypothetical protein